MRLRLSPLAAALLILVSACGGSDDSADNTNEAKSSETSVPVAELKSGDGDSADEVTEETVDVTVPPQPEPTAPTTAPPLPGTAPPPPSTAPPIPTSPPTTQAAPKPAPIVYPVDCGPTGDRRVTITGPGVDCSEALRIIHRYLFDDTLPPAEGSSGFRDVERWECYSDTNASMTGALGGCALLTDRGAAPLIETR